MTPQDRQKFVDTTIQSLLSTQKTVPYHLRVLLTQYLEGEIPFYEVLKELKDDHT